MFKPFIRLSQLVCLFTTFSQLCTPFTFHAGYAISRLSMPFLACSRRFMPCRAFSRRVHLFMPFHAFYACSRFSCWLRLTTPFTPLFHAFFNPVTPVHAFIFTPFRACHAFYAFLRF
jgi:hypothetical protein